MRNNSPIVGVAVIAAAMALGACAKKVDNSEVVTKDRVEAKRKQVSCASSAAIQKVKDRLFDEAAGQQNRARTNLNALADYSTARLENPVVAGRDEALDITQCKGRLIIDMPPGAERGFSGERRLQADIEYSAQAAADGSGLVYQVNGAGPIIAKLAAFNLTSSAFRPPAAIDDIPLAPDLGVTIATDTDESAIESRTVIADRVQQTTERGVPLRRSHQMRPGRAPSAPVPDPAASDNIYSAADSGETVVRAFYSALRAGNGAAASAKVVPEKRSSRAFSPAAINRFYGALPEPIRLTEIAPASAGTYRVRYQYAAGRTKCDGSAIVRLERRGGQDLIRSIQALNGC